MESKGAEWIVSPYEKQVHRAIKRAHDRGLRADLSIEEWDATVEDFGRVCAFCDQPFWTLDHFIPLASKGPSTISNCIPSCYNCNTFKGAHTPDHLWFVSATRIAQIQAYLDRRGQGLRGWPPPTETSMQHQESFSGVTVSKKGATTIMNMQHMQWSSKTFASGKTIVLYDDREQIVLQLQHPIVTEGDVFTPSFRVAVSLTPAETVALALDMLRVASSQLDLRHSEKQNERGLPYPQ